MNAHEAAFAIVCLLAFVKSATTDSDGKSRVNGYATVAIAFALSGLLAFGVGGPPRAMVLFGFQALVEAVGGTSFVNYAVGKGKAGAAATVFLLAMMGAAPVACTPAARQAIATAVPSTLESGCELIGILDPQARAVATVCSWAAPIVGPVIATAIESLGDQKSAPAYTFVELRYGGNAIGVVRADVAAKVQARLDTLAAANSDAGAP